jgi:hypothetical protein
VFDREKYGCWFTHGSFIKRSELMSRIVAEDSLTLLLGTASVAASLPLLKHWLIRALCCRAELEVLETHTDQTFPFHRPVYPFNDQAATAHSDAQSSHPKASASSAAAALASGSVVSPSGSQNAALTPHTSVLLRDMSWLLDNPVCTDVTLHVCKEAEEDASHVMCGGDDIPCHKVRCRPHPLSLLPHSFPVLQLTTPLFGL